MNYTYLLECADKTFYCGWTNDLEKRVNTHNMGRGAKYTKPRRPVGSPLSSTRNTLSTAPTPSNSAWMSITC